MDKGFTLIEAMVAILIIAILAAILLPILSRVRAWAKDVKARAEMRDEAIGWFADGAKDADYTSQQTGSYEALYQANPHLSMNHNYWSTREKDYDAAFDRKD